MLRHAKTELKRRMQWKGREERNGRLMIQQRLVHNQMARAKADAVPKAGTAEEEIIGVTKA